MFGLATKHDLPSDKSNQEILTPKRRTIRPLVCNLSHVYVIWFRLYCCFFIESIFKQEFQKSYTHTYTQQMLFTIRFVRWLVVIIAIRSFIRSCFKFIVQLFAKFTIHLLLLPKKK